MARAWLHLHPRWQLTVVPTLATALPQIQFVLTTHSPLVAGSLEWMNIIVMSPGARPGSTAPARIAEPIHGLDADQVLLTGYFGLDSTRAGDRGKELRELSLRARGGDRKAAQQLLHAMSRGAEAGA